MGLCSSAGEWIDIFWYSTDTGSSVVPGSRAAYRLNRTKRLMGGDPVPNAIEQAMDDQFVDNTLSEYIINWGFHNNAGKNGNTSKKPIITVDSSVNLPKFVSPAFLVSVMMSAKLHKALISGCSRSYMRSGARKWIARKRNWRNLLGRTRRKQSVWHRKGKS